jgi:hypothetical protein
VVLFPIILGKMLSKDLVILRGKKFKKMYGPLTDELR